MSIARHHSEWLSLIEVSGPFLSIPVLMRVFPQGLVAHDPEKMRTLRLAHEEWETNAESGARTNPAIHGAWIKYVLTGILGLPDESILEQQAIPQSIQTTVPEHAELLRPNLVIVEPGTSKPRLLVQTYPLDQDLDKSVSGKTWKASPGTRMMKLLHNTGVRLGLVTNGERWMLVDAPKSETTGFASWYANLWLEEPITLRAFVSLLSADRFFNSPEKDTLEAMLAESASNQQEVTDQLGYQVRRAVEVLVQSLDRADQDQDRNLLGGVDEKLLYEAALTVMMRLVFLFCAEERRLLPIDSELYATHYAASTMREQLRKTADDHGEEILERRHDAWCRLLACFRLVFGGCEHANLRMPAYGGHLFDPDRFPFLEGRKPTTSWRTCEADPLPVNNRTVLHLLEALQMLEVKMPGGEKAARRLSFRALDIEQIGHVYEGLLDHTAKRATEPMLGLAGGRDKEPEVPLAKLEELKAKDEGKLVEFLAEETGRSPKALKKALADELHLTTSTRFEAECGSDRQLFNRVKPFAALIREDTRSYPVVIRKGSVFVTAGTDRRSSGTHYTPRSLTEPIVQYTLEPLVYVGPAEGKPKEQWQLRTPKELLDLKICDMACGSGAFLVQACRYLSERLVEAWDRAEKTHPGTPGITPEGEASKGATGEALIPKDADERMAYAKRLVAQRCLYGVDINPLAAEMAKLSLWLLTLAKDKPFTFLDHTIRCGDSLLGVHDPRQLKNFSLNPNEHREWQFNEVPLNELVDEAIGLRLKIELMAANTVEDIARQEELFRASEAKLTILKAASDFIVAAEFAGSSQDRFDRLDAAAIRFGQLLKTLSGNQLREASERSIGRRRFHWPFEFPEVLIARNGFDALIGNPPFITGKRISSHLGSDYEAYLKASYHDSKGAADICCFFVRRAFELSKADTGQFGAIATKSIAEGDSRLVGLVPLLDRGAVLRWVRHEIKWPGSAGVTVSLMVISKAKWNGALLLDDRIVTAIGSKLTENDDLAALPLAANKGNCSDGIKIQGDGFILADSDRELLLLEASNAGEVISPYITGMDMVQGVGCKPTSWIVNFRTWNRDTASAYRGPFKLVTERVKPYRDSLTGQIHEKDYWKFWDKREQFFERMATAPRILACPSTAKYLIMTSIEKEWVASHSVKLFAYHDGWSFAVLQSATHETWAREQSGKLEQRLAYNLTKAFATFPWPLKASSDALGDEYCNLRHSISQKRGVCFTDLYNLVHDAAVNSADIDDIRNKRIIIDTSVIAAYGWDDLDLGHGFHETKQGTRFTISEKARREVLARLLKLNHERYAEEVAQGLHDKKKSAKPRATKTAVSVPETADMGLFASMAYPATDADRSICAAALSIVEARPGLSSMEHLDALLLVTQPEWCAAFLDDADAKAVKRAVRAAPKALVVTDGTPINWKQSRDHLEQRGAIRVIRGDAEQSLQLGADSKAVAAVKASFSSGTESIVALALKAVARLTALKDDLAAATEDQKRFVIAIQREEKVLQLVA